MFDDLRSLVRLLGEDRRDPVRRRWHGMLLFTLASQVLILSGLVDGIANLRAGADYTRDVLLYALGSAAYYDSSQRLKSLLHGTVARRTRDLVRQLVDGLVRLPLATYETFSSGHLVARLTGDVERVMGAGRVLFLLPGILSRLVLGFIVGVSISPTAARMSAAALLGIAVLLASQQRALSRAIKGLGDDEAELYELLRGHTEGASLIKLHAPRARALRERVSATSEQIQTRREGAYASFFSREHDARSLLFLALGINAFILPLVGPTSLESVLEVNFVLLWASFSVQGLSRTLPALTITAKALTRLQELHEKLAQASNNAPDEAREDTRAPAPEGARGERREEPPELLLRESIRVRGVEFAYPTRSTSGGHIGPLDVTVGVGELIFVTGDNGGGKSTFIKVLTGLYEPDVGTIEVDGRVLNGSDRAAYRGLFSAIFTEHHLFARVFGIPAEKLESEGSALLREFGIADKTGFDGQRITDRDLSTGQKKRLAMVLALLRDRPVLVFDEWAADQDPEHRADFYRRLLPALRDSGKLVIAVTHDDQYFDLADRVLVFRDGQVVESSTEGRA